MGLFESRNQRDPYAVDVQQSSLFWGATGLEGGGGGLGLRNCLGELGGVLGSCRSCCSVEMLF